MIMVTVTSDPVDGSRQATTPRVDSVHRAQVFAFGNFEFSASSGELRSESEVVRLAPQPASVLHIMLQRAGEVVTRKELSATLWPHGFIEADLGINHCLRQVRRALSDNATDPVYIETLRRRGYRFMISVEERSAARRVPSRTDLLEASKGSSGGSESMIQSSGVTAIKRKMGVAGAAHGLTMMALILALKGALPLVLFLPLAIMVAVGGVFATHLLEKPMLVSRA